MTMVTNLHLQQITARINKLCYGLDLNFVDPVAITQKVYHTIRSATVCCYYNVLTAFYNRLGHFWCLPRREHR
jgi:hypothetical protein